MQNVPLKIAMTATIIIRLMTLWFATLLGILCCMLPYKKISKRINL